MKLTLPYPPTVNHMYRGGGRRFLTDKAKAFYRDVEIVVFVSGCRRRTLKNVAVTIHINPPDYKVRDIDNVLKPILDGLTKSKRVWKDDRQVKELHAYFGDKVKNGQVTVEVEGMGA